MLLYIEDLITYICRNFKTHSDYVPLKDKTVFFSLMNQFGNNIALTVGQSNLALRLLENNKNTFSTIKGFNELLDIPKFKYPFRTIDTAKKIYIEKLNDKDVITIKFQYNKELLKEIKDEIPGKSLYNKEKKSYSFPLNEKNILNILSNQKIKNYNFDIDSDLLNLYENIDHIYKNKEEFVPTVDYENGLIIKNTNKLTRDYFENNKKDIFLSDLFLAKSLRLNFGKKLIDKLISMNLDTKIPYFLTEKKKSHTVINSKKTNMSMFIQSLKTIDIWPIMVILPEFDTVDVLLDKWYSSLKENGISNKEISVLFRSQKNKSFNAFVADEQLNNLVSEETKVVFINHKIPKVLYKIDFKPLIVISTSVHHVHYTTKILTSTHPFVIYYTDQISFFNSEIEDA